MEIAAMNEIVVFQKQALVKDAIGNHLDVWSSVYSCYATISGENGKEQAVAGETVESVDMNVTVRYSSETAEVTSTGYRIVFNDELYDILAIDHLNFKKNALKFRCRKVRR